MVVVRERRSRLELGEAGKFIDRRVVRGTHGLP